MKPSHQIPSRGTLNTPALVKSNNRGFALVVTLSLMILLTILAVGLLSLSSVALRNSTAESASNRAKANAELAMMLALGQLQETLGDDRRISADASILSDATLDKLNVVGAWNSWSPRLAEDPGTTAAPDYIAEKGDTSGNKKRFERWLISANNPNDLTKVGWAKAGSLTKPEKLFTLKSDGFDLAGEKVDVEKGTVNAGSYAWAITQENTRAKINVGGPETDRMIAKNDILQSQPRPGLGLSKALKQPAADWNLRASRVISIDQSKLDADLINDPAVKARADFTTQSMGLLTDGVKGGLKTDLSLGFELSDSDFERSNWADGLKNPFKRGVSPGTDGSSNYAEQRTLFKPLSPGGTVKVELPFAPANTQFDFPVAAVPTFHTLRSFYRTPYHLYNTQDGITAFERGADNVSLTRSSVSSGFYSSPSKSPPALKTQTGYRPVADRVMLLLSIGLNPNDEICFFVTPVVTLWNPYNVALQIEGAVTYPWIDFPFSFTWSIKTKTGSIEKRDFYTSGLLGQQFGRSNNHGRSVDPFFYVGITQSGETIVPNTGPITFRPGEVRVFVPDLAVVKDFKVAGTVQERMVFLKPVEDIGQFSTKGGLRIGMSNPVRNIGFTRKLVAGEEASLSFRSAGTYPYFMSLEDATLAKQRAPAKHEGNGGQAIADVLAMTFNSANQVVPFTSPSFRYDVLKSEPRPVGVIEFYHRVAKSGTAAETADLVLTGNPRQASMAPQVSNTTFPSGTQYRVRTRGVSSFSGVLETTPNGRSAFYGATNGASDGVSNLSFFEAPRAPMLSLAGFQHADLTLTPYGAAYQFANSWASAYIKRESVSVGRSGASGRDTLNYDFGYLANETLWDGFFFSGAAPDYSQTSRQGNAAVWNSSAVKVNRDLPRIIQDFVTNPTGNPLRNPRMQLYKGVQKDQDIINELSAKEGCLKISKFLMLDGAFNVNSTSVEAWTAVLSGLRGQSFDVTGGGSSGRDSSSFSRMGYPIGNENDNWQGFRSLNDTQVRSLATAIVAQVKLRGPFLSLGEFINRRVERSALGLQGAIEAAIGMDRSINEKALMGPIDRALYDSNSRENISPANTGVGIPGYLTQADVLQSLAPSLTTRSDTFIIRGYGEARDRNGNLQATARCEVVVQRLPDFLDPSNKPEEAMVNLSEVNKKFGRKFAIVSFRFLSASEMAL